MKRVLFTILLLVIANVYQLSAQSNSVLEDRPNAIGLELGINRITLLDQSFSELDFTGLVPRLGFTYLNQKGNNYWATNLNVNVGTITDDGQYFDSQYLKAGFNFAYARMIQETDRQHLYIGSRLRSELMLMVYNGFDAGSWLTNQILDLNIISQINLAENQFLEFNFTYPIIGFIARPPYAGVDKFVSDNVLTIPKILYGRSEFKTGIQYINPSIKLTYIREWERLMLMLQLEETFLSYQSAKRIQQNNLAISLQLLYKFGKA